MDSRTLVALKNLAVKVTGKTLAQVKGDTVDEVIAFINANLNVTANKLVLADSTGKPYDVTVSTTGTLVVTARS